MPDAVEFTHWLIKAEPETRIEKGVDVKFSIDDLERNKTTTWEGVRNHEAKKYLKSQMKVGHECLFYASNCKVPGVSGLARVIKEGYPDFNAWDPKHPYYDPKSKKDAPTWFMVEVEFVAKLPHLVPLALLHALIRRGRLSVQPVGDDFFEAAKLLGERGGWDEWEGARGVKGLKGGAKKVPGGEEEKVGAKGKGKGKGKAADEEEGAAKEEEVEGKPATAPRAKPARSTKSKSKVKPEPDDEDDGAAGSSEDEVTTGGKRRGANGASRAGTRSSKRLRGTE
ncbi:uncharacterized protein RHOBADRAFT_54662 [Rhodotorula graminis WP1]|uniref:EVE domain-containing protein n=1 Tax=Rhodotorula graminis (strain WP1) TaxID=578459 RepID=A0A0N8Q045_RHOGW|nr:uncharacterized protein RHOBADRAFT_54662 [Rhodotorula graminis WP1]KPV74101.1 hypothetical protein RHOBADRAFT_54662 [Rhodotorula graminis WP1]